MTATATPTSDYLAAPNSGKGRLKGAFENAVKAIEARNNGAQPQ